MRSQLAAHYNAFFSAVSEYFKMMPQKVHKESVRARESQRESEGARGSQRQPERASGL